MFFLYSARWPHRTAKPSRGCLPLAHPRALPAVKVSDRRSPSAMFEFPFECWCWGCILWSAAAEGLLGKLSYRPPQWALMARLMQKERLKSPHKSLFYVTGPFWSFWSFLEHVPFWSFWLAISEPGRVSRKKSATCGLA